MAEQDTGQQRSEQPTAGHLEDAGRKGQIARSRELNTLLVIVLAAVGIMLMGQGMIADISALLEKHLQISRSDIFDVRSVLRMFNDGMLDALWSLLPFFVIVLVAALLAPMALGGWAFSFEALQPRLSRLDPVKGLKRVFSAGGLMELVKTFAKFVLVAAVAITVIWVQLDQFIQLGYASMRSELAHAGELFSSAFLWVGSALIAIAAIDVPFQIRHHNRQMRMSRQAVKDKMKPPEGKSEVKARMLEQIPGADVVVTDSTHFAVALKYDQQAMRSPTLVARGADLVADHIRRVAEENDVLLVETPPLARALYHSTDIGQEIPEGLYVAVAQVLAYVYQLKAVQKNGGEKPSRPDPEIPEACKKYAEKGADPDPVQH